MFFKNIVLVKKHTQNTFVDILGPIGTLCVTSIYVYKDGIVQLFLELMSSGIQI